MAVSSRLFFFLFQNMLFQDESNVRTSLCTVTNELPPLSLAAAAAAKKPFQGDAWRGRYI